MKKLKVLLMLVLMFFASCKAALSVPTSIKIDVNNTLSWSAVAGARRYLVEITDVEEQEPKEYSSQKISYSLSFLDEGDYEIRIRAISGSGNAKNSAWSERIDFQKARETGCIYKLVNNVEYHIIDFGAASGKVEIEDFYRGKPVTAIAASAFKGCREIEEVIVGNNVVSIGEKAFYNCPNLEKIKLPDGLESIGVAAFHSCPSLTSISIPDGVKEISDDTFNYCRGLTSIKWGAGLVSIGEAAFANCSGLTEVIIPDSVQTLGPNAFYAAYHKETETGLTSITLGANTQQIGAYAFVECKALKNIHFNKSGALTRIGEYAFNSCVGLESVELPNGLTEIGEGAFYKCEGLQSVTIPDSVRYIRRLAFNAAGFYSKAANEGAQFIYADNKWLLTCTTKAKKDEDGQYIPWELVEEDISKGVAGIAKGTIGIADYALSESKGLEAVTIPQSVRYLGDYAFSECPSLYNVNLSRSSIEEIGERAFTKCPILSILTLQKNNGASAIKRIGSYAFYGCSSLQNVNIPKSVISIGTYAFKNTKLWNDVVKAGGDVIYAGNWVVGYNPEVQITDVKLEDGTVGIADYAFYQCKDLKSVENLHLVENLGYAAFYKCSSLERAQLNTDITVIQPYTFYKCTSLWDITLPDRLLAIGRSAFYKCETLNELDLSNIMTFEDEDGNEIGLIIDDYAFYGCTNIEKINFSESTQGIGNYAFYKCSNLRTLNIQDSITYIGDRAFGNCSALESLSLGKGINSIGERAFQNCASLTELVIPANIESIGNYAFYKCKALVSVTIEDGEGAFTIGNYAFYGAENLQRLYLPRRLTSIGKYAFKGSALLQSVVLGENVTEIGMHAFYGCKTLTFYVEAEAPAKAWHTRWNSSYRPVVYGCVLSQDGKYVVSVTINENSFANVKDTNVFTSPKQSGYTFAGWSATVDGEEKIYQASEITSIPVGTTLTAVWTNGDEPLVEVPEEEPKEEGAENSSVA